MLTVIVADDEKLARRRLVRLVEETGDAEVVAACAGGRETIEQVIALQPQVLFLDVQMPDQDGFAVLRAIQGRASPVVVFVTAFDQYAVRAFDVHAVDYLLKPFDTARFRAAFGRARERLHARTAGANDETLRAILAGYAPPPPRADGHGTALDRITVKVKDALRIIKISDVDWWETNGNYLRVHVGPATHLVRMTSAALEARLDPRMFIRIHRRYIVNVDRIVEIEPWFAGDGVIVLKDGTKLRLSRTHRERLYARLGGKMEPEETNEK